MENMSAEAIAQRLRLIRKAAGMKRDDLSKLSGISNASISYWEHGKVKSPIKPKSLNKLIIAFEKVGLEVTEKWLKEGVGEFPTFKGEKITTVNNLNNDINYLGDNQSLNLTTELANIVSNEIKIFTSIKQAILLKVSNSNFFPFLDKGDLIGGAWQAYDSLKEPSLCIVEINKSLEVFFLEKTENTNVFKVYKSYTSMIDKTFTMQTLEKLAPVIRFWR